MNQKDPLGVWGLITLASIPLVMTLGNSMLIPVLPVFEEKIGISSFQSSLIITSYSVSAIFLIPIAGYLSDRYGRKIVILPSLILTLIGGVIAAYASWKMENPFVWIVVGRILQGVGASGATPIILPLVGDLYKDDDEKASENLGVVETSNTFGKVLSPIVGAFFATILWYLPFISIAVFSLISFVLVLLFIKVPRDIAKPPAFRTFLAKTKKIFTIEGPWLYTIFGIGAYVMLVLFGELFFLSDIFEKEHGIEGVRKGVLLAVPLIVLCVTAFVIGKWIKGSLPVMKTVMIISMVILSLSVGFVGFSESPEILLLFISVNGLAIGALLPTLDAMITENIQKDARGTITSIYSAARFIGVAAGPPLMSLLMKNFLEVSYLVAGGIGILLLGAIVLFIRPERT
ncbi:MFS transporter [Allobacillus sp. GCM10007491]|uniref:MFS transporter n=1 Tax=Allobacillus saliphilus TaxID=2912308 RepID=A0A941CVZ8_9BACI|nr:MFS transporter [Allobacillus saliphilus]MBR7554689.1 MFS transporter [Allobacillus saliphilus]